MSDVNSMYFDKKDIESGLFIKFLNHLIEYNLESNEHYLDIHIKKEDCEAMIIEWVQNSYDYEFSKFVELNEDECVMKEIHFPDGHYEYASCEAEEKELWDNWINEHPNWEKDQWGIWREKQE